MRIRSIVAGILVLGLALPGMLARVPAAFAQQPPAPAKPEQAVLPPAPGDEDTEDLVEAMRQLKGIKIKSLFFDKDEIGYIRYSLRIYLKDTQSPAPDGFDESEFLKRFSTARFEEEKVTAFVYPQFFVNSIAYHTPDRWAVWVTDSSGQIRQINQSNNVENAEIRVLKIDDKHVTLQWKPLVMDKVNETWANAHNDEVEVNTLRNTVTFTLQSNQTFTSFLMRVVDGKVKPVMIGNDIAPAPGAETAQPSPESMSPAAAQAEEKQGIMGLLNQYKTLPTDSPVGAPPPVSNSFKE